MANENAERVESLLHAMTLWARRHPDIRAVAVVGSCARDEMTAESDIDVVVITDDRARYAATVDWASGIPDGAHLGTRRWGAIVEQRFRLGDGLELDIGIADPSWAATDPVDVGTKGVVRDGFRALHDPDGILARLIQACR